MPSRRSRALQVLIVLSTVCYALTTSSNSRAINGGGVWVGSTSTSSAADDIHEPPEGYYAFIESANAEPPRVRRPPYQHTNARCPGIGQLHPHASLDNLCGDLNQGIIPRNPMDQNVMGSSYPFAIIKNKTLEFFSKTLPILKEDDTLPKVAKYHQTKKNSTSSFYYKDTRMNSLHHRMKREGSSSSILGQESLGIEMTKPSEHETYVNQSLPASNRQSRKFCDNGGGVICMLYKAFRGEPLASGMGERKDEEPSHGNTAQYRRGEVGDVGGNSIGRFPGGAQHGPPPPTPCPSKADYATPVFARNYQGVWRYVVQIPYEGYFTQTLEVTRCLQSRCHYMEGSCMASPRWVSLLVAEIFYPDSVFPSIEAINGAGKPPRRQRPALQSTERPPPSVHDFQDYQQYLNKRAGEAAPEKYQNHHHPRRARSTRKDNDSADNSERAGKSSGSSGYCDGKDEMGCFQVRLYYDWFLIPGSCKCWKQDYFSRYVNRKV
ncbi:uncharacterized protein LOC124169120 [Ischnura elegans]|uniref:uncharacterized protein LOC124169120 n=1 Tax=Ischnura elegans TaxID=197161 RepID=UPI001ED8AA9F|nr:uncharacterized protein LOC124169120 [Ischnura elegans]